MNEDIPSRRIVLRGALAVGCSLLLPISLSGCDAKNSANSTATNATGTNSTSPGPAVPPASNKVSQASVLYQGQPKGEQKCGVCTNFIAESNTCKLVDGQVSQDGWCSLWSKKS